MRNQDRSSLAEFKRIKSLQVKVFFLNEAFRQELITFQHKVSPTVNRLIATTLHPHHTIHWVVIIIRPKRQSLDASRITCKFQPFLIPFINTTCSNIDCYVLSVPTSHLAGHTVWNQLSSLLLLRPHWLLKRLTALTGGAGVDFDKVLISLSLWMEESCELCKIHSLTSCKQTDCIMSLS